VPKQPNDIEKQEKKKKVSKEESKKSFLLFFGLCAEHDSQTRHKDIAANENVPFLMFIKESRFLESHLKLW
jgi:hypothetical protein